MQYPTPEQAFQRLAVTVQTPDSPKAFRHDAFSYLADKIRDHPYDLVDSDEIIFLGRDGQVGHAIIVRGVTIIADRQIDVLGVDSSYTFSFNQTRYTTKLSAHSPTLLEMSVVGRSKLGDFKAQYGLAPPAPSEDLIRDY
ncbi:MAG: hypothetical protein H6858_00030 [Rhodospirillales bacterium]|nr:hypothetical protein [Alphaproteobacteria bacterium]MCB1841137.1 hypothetical protein [Alphaproteobacteria bacterium]MCB9975970.1 hypothetical protein [Rhodospirillales bacterium]